MAEILIKKGKKYNIFDKINNVWNQLSIWTHADDVEFSDGKTASTKVGALNGITSDLSGESETVAASIKCVNQLNSSLTDLANYIGYEFGSLIPKLSGNSSSIITSGYNTNNNAYGYDDHAYIGYDFGNKQQISKCKVVFINKDTISDNVTIKIQGSNDNSNWTDISTFSTGTLDVDATYKYTKEVSANYRYYRAYKVSSTAYSRFAIVELDFYK